MAPYHDGQQEFDFDDRKGKEVEEIEQQKLIFELQKRRINLWKV